MKRLLLHRIEKKPEIEIQERYADIRGRKISYLQAGSGPPLLLIHGLLGGSFCWRFNLPVFAQKFTTYAINLPGCGESERPRDGDFGMAAQVQHLRSFTTQFGLKEFGVVGCSWGGGIAQLFAAANPALVRSLVLVSPVNPWSEFGLGRVQFFSGALGAALLRAGMPFSRPLHLWGLKRMYGDPKRMPAGTLEGYSRLFLSKGLAGNVVQILRAWRGDLEALKSAPQKIQAPTLLIWGTHDTAVDPGSAATLKARIPGCELEIINGAGHVPFEETPEEFNRITLGFLERVAATPSAASRAPGH